MKTVKRRIFSGAVCEQVVYNIADGANVKRSAPRMRFRDESERKAHRDGIARRRHARLVNANCTPETLYGTLTFDNDHEVHTFADAKKIGTIWMRRMKKAYPDAVIFLYCGRGKGTARIHFHTLTNGIPADFLCQTWEHGSVVRVEALREHNRYEGVDYGCDYTGLANYLFEHWTPEQGGKRYRMTTNVRHADTEEAEEVKRKYTPKTPPRAPRGYRFVECFVTTYGYGYYKYVKVPEKKKKTNLP